MSKRKNKKNVLKEIMDQVDKHAAEIHAQDEKLKAKFPSFAETIIKATDSTRKDPSILEKTMRASLDMWQNKEESEEQQRMREIADIAGSMPPIEQQQNQAILNKLTEISEKLTPQIDDPIQENPKQPEPVTQMPPQNATLYTWFDFMYSERARGIKFTLDELAEKSPFSRSHIGKEHPKYRKSQLNKK